jgi:F-type H+-transporting ATPase subunit delta
MRQYKVANRYAKALFTLAVETNQLETVNRDVELISAIDHEEFRRVLMSPIISGDKKAELFRAVYGKSVSELTSKFFNLVFQKGRVTSLSEIRADFEEQYRAYKKIKIVKLTTAVPISDTLVDDLRKGIMANPQYQEYTLQMESIVDERLIGGFVLQIGDDFYDASIRHDLDVIKKQFVENMYVQKIR